MTRFPVPGNTRAPRTVLGGIALLVALLASLLALSVAPPAGAIEPEDPQDEQCYEQVPHYEYERGDRGQDEILEHQIAKHTRERSKVWVQTGEYFWQGEYQWTPWSDPVLWNPLSHDSYVLNIPAPDWQPHGTQRWNYQRQWALLPTGATNTVQEAVPSTYESTGWLSEPPEQGDGPEWTIKAGPKNFDGDRIPCEDKPDADVEERRIDDCVAGVVIVQTRTIDYVLNDDFEWVPGEPGPWVFSHTEPYEGAPCPTGTTPTTTTTTTPDDPTTTTTPDDPTTTTTEEAGVLGIDDEAGVGGIDAAQATLPRTGGDAGGLALAGALILGFGAVLRRAGRRLS